MITRRSVLGPMVLAALGAPFAARASGGLTVMVSYADWCGPCQILMPKLEAAAASFDAGAISFVLIDFTELTYDNFETQFAKAAPVDRSEFMEGAYVKTGFALLMKDGAIMARVSAGMTVDDIVSTMRAAAA